MRKLLFALVVIWALGFFTQNATAEIIASKSHRDWASFIVKGKEVAMSRMMTQGADKSSYLVVDFIPGTCEVGMPRIFIPYDKIKKTDEVKIGYGRLRIDTKEIIDISYKIATDDGLIFFNVEGASGEKIFRDALWEAEK